MIQFSYFIFYSINLFSVGQERDSPSLTEGKLLYCLRRIPSVTGLMSKDLCRRNEDSCARVGQVIGFTISVCILTPNMGSKDDVRHDIE